MPTCSICGHSGLDHRSSADCVARLLRQLEEIRGDYDRLEERYNALAGTLRQVLNFCDRFEAAEGRLPGLQVEIVNCHIRNAARNALAFAGDPEIDR